MKPVLKYGNIPGKNILEFPRSFLFFDYLIKKGPSIVPLKDLRWIIFHFQIVAFPLLPFFVKKMSFGENYDILANVYTILLTYQKADTILSQKFISILEIFVFSLCIGVFMLLCFQFFKNQGCLPNWVTVIQELVFDLHPLNLLFPLMNAIGYNIYISLSEPSVVTIAYINIIYTVINFLFLICFYYWAIPLSFSIQFQSRTYSTAIIPQGKHLFWSIFVYFMLSVITIASNSSAVILETEIILLEYSIYRAWSMYTRPSNSVVRFWALLSAYTASSINCVLVIFYIYFPKIKEIYFCAILFFVWFSCSIICFIVIQRKNRKIDDMIENSNFSKSSTHDILYICQRALYTSKLSKTVIAMMDEAYSNDQSLDNLVSLVAIQVGYDVHRQDLDTMITFLSTSYELPRITQFLVFELYKKYTNASKLVCYLNGIDTLDTKIQSFKNLSDKFWRSSMSGHTDNSIKIIGWLKVLCDDLCYDYRLFETFFPSHSKVHVLYNEFFKKFLNKSDSKMSDFSKVSFVEDNVVNISETNSDSSLHSSSSSSSSDEELRNGQQQWISDNIKKLTQSTLNLPLFITSLIVWIISISVFVYMMRNPTDSKSTSYQQIPDALNSLQKVTTQWLKISYMIDGLASNNSLVKINRSELENILQVKSYITNSHEIFSNMSEILISLQKYLSETEFEIVKLDPSDLSLKQFKEQLFGQSVIIDNYNLSLDEVISYTSSNLIGLKKENENITESEFISELNQTKSFLFGITNKIEGKFVESLNTLSSIVSSRFDSLSSFDKHTVFISMSIIVLTSVVTVIIFTFVLNHFAMIIIKHMRPSAHPNPTIEVKLSETYTRNLCSDILTGLIIIYLFVLSILFGCYFGIIRFMNDRSKEIYRYSSSTISVQNTTQKLGLLAMKLITSNYTNSSNADAYSFFINVSYILDEINSATMLLFYHLQSKHFPKSRGRILMDFLSKNSCTLTRESHLADIFSCFGIAVNYNFFAYFAERIDTEDKFDKTDFAHIQYLYLDLIMSDLNNLSDILLNLSHHAILEYNYFDHLKIGILCILIIFLFFVFYEISFTLYVLDTQFGRQISFLSPMFIVQHQCLVSYIADLTEDDNKESKDMPFFEIYDSSGVSVVALNDKLCIIAFTKEVLQIFGYKEDQLYGQNIETLVPCNENIWKNNDKKFYRQIELVKTHEAASRFSRTVTGCCSDRTPIDLKTSVSYVETSQGNFFVIEFRSIARETFYEEQYINSSKLINQYRSSAMPIMLFTEDQALNKRMSFKDTLKVRYRHYAAVYIGLIIDDNFEMSDLNESSFSPMKDILSISSPLYSGVSGALVIDATCETALVIFVNDEDNDSHLHNAIGFSLDFSEKNIYPTHGVIIDGDDLDVCLHPLPDISFKEQQIRPQMSIEPSSDVLTKLSKVIQLSIENCLILPTAAAELISDVPSLPFANDLGLDLSFIEIKISSYVAA